jgi:hypothetical protein
MRFSGGLLLGLILGGAGGAGATYVLLQPKEPELAPLPPPSDPPSSKKPRKPRRAARPAGEPAPEALTAEDLRVRAEGDALRAAATEIDMAGGAEARALTQEEIDSAIAARGAAIVDCITRARGDAEVTGRVTAGMVVAADGRVVKSRIEAPAYLLERGLATCARRELAALRFPAAGRETVVTVPFDVTE